MTSCAKMLNVLMLVYNRKFIYCGLNSVKFPNFWSFLVKMIFLLKISLELELTFRDLGNKINIIYCGVYFSIDASKENWAVGRLINDSKYFPNARMKKIVRVSRSLIYVFLQLETLIYQKKFYSFMVRRTYHGMNR